MKTRIVNAFQIDVIKKAEELWTMLLRNFQWLCEKVRKDIGFVNHPVSGCGVSSCLKTQVLKKGVCFAHEIILNFDVMIPWKYEWKKLLREFLFILC